MMKTHSLKHNLRHKNAVKGATLLEVLVSVFLLTFGILGLMAAQLRSVSAVAESEAQAIVAQAAENLAEAMQANPDFKMLNAAKNEYERNYSRYIAKTSSLTDVTTKTLPTAISGKDKTKDDVVTAQLAEFEYVLSQIPNAISTKYIICNDKAANIKAATMSAGNCDNAASSVVIKVVWTTQDKNAKNSDGSEKESIETIEQNYALVVPL